MKLSIVIPAYNEERTVWKTLVRCRVKWPKAELIVVDDASNDMTPEWLTFFKLRTIRNKVNIGHAKSLLKGLRAAKGDYILYLDADDQIPLVDLPIGYDIVSGYRVKRKDKLFRKIVSFILKTIILIRHGYYIRDANCPYKLFKRSTLRQIIPLLPIDCILPTVDLTILFLKTGHMLYEIPVRHRSYKNRKGMLQSINRKSLSMFWKSLLEVIRL